MLFSCVFDKFKEDEFLPSPFIVNLIAPTISHYFIVMADPDTFPPTPPNMTPQASPHSTRSYSKQDIPTVEPPEYPALGMVELPNQQVAGLLPPLPSYEAVSESDDEWFPLNKKARLSRKNKTTDNDDTDNPPPSYLSVTSEGSDIDLRPISNDRVRSKLRSRSSRTSISTMQQAQKNNSESSDEEDIFSNKPNVRIRLPKPKSNKESKLEPTVEEASLSGQSTDNENCISKQIPTKDSKVFNEDEDDTFETEPVSFRFSNNNDSSRNDQCVYHTDGEAGTNHKVTVTNKRFSPVLDKYSTNFSSYNELARHAILNNSFRNSETSPNTSISANNVDIERGESLDTRL